MTGKVNDAYLKRCLTLLDSSYKMNTHQYETDPSKDQTVGVKQAMSYIGSCMDKKFLNNILLQLAGCPPRDAYPAKIVYKREPERRKFSFKRWINNILSYRSRVNQLA